MVRKITLLPLYLNIIFNSNCILCVALCGVVMYNYIKVKDVKASQNPPESVNNVERMSNDDDNVRSSNVDEEAPLMASSRLSHIARRDT